MASGNPEAETGRAGVGQDTLVFQYPWCELRWSLVFTLVSLVVFVVLVLVLNSAKRGQSALGLFVLLPAAAILLLWSGYRAASGFVSRGVIYYDVDADGVRKTAGSTYMETAWTDASPFSETAITHRDGDRFCRLKSRDGLTLMEIGSHMLGGAGEKLLAEIRLRLGEPSLEGQDEPEVFKYADFGNVPPFHIELTAQEVAAVSAAGELRLPFDKIESIMIRAWPEVGAGLERVRMIGEERMIEIDSRVVGFWPLVDYVTAHAPNAALDDRSRRARLAGKT